MRKIFVPLLLIGLAFGLLQVQDQIKGLRSVSTFVSLVAWAEESSVSIEAFDNDGNLIGKAAGVIISPEGLVLTAGHVVNNATVFKVISSDGSEFSSSKKFNKEGIVDIGFIKLDVSYELPFSHLGNYNDLRKGQDVFIIGNPFGLRLSVMKGIISAFDRDISLFGERPTMQLDISAFPGNSGSPVFDMQGRVIGVFVGQRLGYDSMGIAYAVDVIKELIKDLEL